MMDVLHLKIYLQVMVEFEVLRWYTVLDIDDLIGQLLNLSDTISFLPRKHAKSFHLE